RASYMCPPMTSSTSRTGGPATESAYPSAPLSYWSELAWLDPRRWRPLFAQVPREIWVVAVVGAVGLTLQELVFLPSRANAMMQSLTPWGWEWLKGVDEAWRRLAKFLWWSGGGLFA